MRNTVVFFSAFAALGAAVFGLQYIPAIGFIGMYIGAPFFLGALLHLGLLVMLVLTAFGWLPRLLMIVPLAVWLAGGAMWFLATRAVDAEALALKTQIPLAQPPREIVIRGSNPIATELVADYQIDAVYTEFHRHFLAKASDCTPPLKHDPKRLLWLPPKLLPHGECVISQRIDEPPAKLLEVTSIKDGERATASGGERVPMKVTAFDSEPPKSWTITYGTEQVPAPLVFPIVGFFYGSQASERGMIAELWRMEVPLVPGAGDDTPNEAKARLIAQALGLKRRHGG
jgi:hypothetical protein